MKIAISGSAGTGKTTLALALAARFECTTIDESFDSLFDASYGFIKPSARLQHQIVETLECKNKLEEEHADFVADRCPVDLFNLWLSRGFAESRRKTADLYARSRTYIQKYDRIIVLPWSALPLVQISDPGARTKRRRTMNAWVQLHNHSTVIGLLQQWVSPERLLPIPFRMVDPAARVDFVANSLDKH